MNIFFESFSYIRKFNKSVFKDWKRISIFIFLILVIMISKQIFPLLMKFIIDDILPNKKADIFHVYIFVLVGAKILEFISIFFSSLLNVIISSKFILDLKVNFFKLFFKLNASFIENHGSGQIFQRLNNDTQNIQVVIFEKFFNFFQDIIQLLILVPIILYLNVKLTVLMVAFMPITVYGSIHFGKILRKISKERLSRLDQLNTFTLERIQKYRLVKYNSTEKYEIRNFFRLYKNYFRALYKNNLFQEYSYIFYKISVEFTPIVIFLYGGYLIFQGQTTIGTVIAFLNFNTRFFYPVKNIFIFAGSLHQLVNSFERYFEYFHDSNFENEGSRVVGNIDSIKFENVDFSYQEDKQILCELDFTIQVGKKAAIVGESGIGKSTIIDLLMGLYQPIKGQIMISGINMNEINLSLYRHKVAVVTQDSFILNDTIKENIVYNNKNVSEDKLNQIIKIACLENLVSSPKGIFTIVGENGVKLSGGEKQRISIARALLKDCDLYIFDESTSNIDVITESILWQNIFGYLKGKTVLIIAHRLSTIVTCDKISVLKEGHIIEEGNSEELIAKKGIFYNMLQHGKIIS